jgi:pimeloyl-ACP methyl ester carboxylesterase
MNASDLNPRSVTRTLRHFTFLAIVLVLGYVGTLFLAPTSQAEEAPTTTHDFTTMGAIGAEPTIVLVGGAWVNASSWKGVAVGLQQSGYTVDVHAVPLRGLASDAAQLSKYLRTIKGPVVLVGHSYSGAVITNIRATPSVKALVYINAFAPAKGESVLKLASARPGSAIAGDTGSAFNMRLYPGARHGDADLYVKTGVFVNAFANDLSSKQAAALAATQRPLTLNAINGRSATPAWRTIPSWYLIGTADRIIPPAEQLFMARRAHSNVAEANTGHLSPISDPNAVTNLILAAAASLRSNSSRCDPLTSCVEPTAPQASIPSSSN